MNDFLKIIEDELRQGKLNYSAVIMNNIPIIIHKESGQSFILNKIEASSLDEAKKTTEKIADIRKRLLNQREFPEINPTKYPIIISEDRYRGKKEVILKRMLANMEIFDNIFARDCEVRKIERTLAHRFLENTHSYGSCSSKYNYGIFIKKEGKSHSKGSLIGVATFSKPKRWKKEGQIVNSYEWLRYSSLPNIRISGGMGKILKFFINEVHPDDIMSYVDLEWSDGKAYRTLGFEECKEREAIDFTISTLSWSRVPIKHLNADSPSRETINPLSPDLSLGDSYFYFRNFGSKKYRLKLGNYDAW